MRVRVQCLLLSLLCVSIQAQDPQHYTFSNGHEGFSATRSEIVSRNRDRKLNEYVSLKVNFPGTSGLGRSLSFKSALPSSVKCDILIPQDAPPDLKIVLYMKDKDGLWFQTNGEYEKHNPSWQGISFDISPASPSVHAVGHQAVWNSYYSRHVVESGIQLQSNATWGGEIGFDNVTYSYESPAKSTLALRDFHLISGAPQAYEIFEIGFTLDGVGHLNPCDSLDIEVDGVFKSSSGKETVIPAFYYQPFRRSMEGVGAEVITPSGRGEWRLRFTPLEPGPFTWRVRVKAKTGSVETREHAIVVNPGTKKGFVRVSKSDSRYFETIDGRFFYPIGHNISAPRDKRFAEVTGMPFPADRGTYAFDRFFEQMGKNGENAVVTWMSSWWLSIEWNDKWKGFNGLADFNLGNAWRLDHVMNKARQHGIHVQLVIDNHGKLSKYVDAEWKDNPYSKALGGPCRIPEEFFASDDAFRLYTNRLRYIVARWGAYSNLLGYELINEMNFVGSNDSFAGDPSHVVWLKKVREYLDKTDSYSHPISVQYAVDYTVVDANMAALPELDYFVGDCYKQGGSIIPLILRTAKENSRFKKPTFSTEFGGSWDGTTTARFRADLHAGIWSNYMTTSSATPFFWWFDFIEWEDLYKEFASLRKFAEGDDPRGIEWSTAELKVQRSDKTIPDLGAIALISRDQARFWVYDKFAAEVMPDRHLVKAHPPSTVLLSGLTPGKYEIEYWDTSAGTMLESKFVEVDTTGVCVSIPQFKIDIVGKIRPVKTLK